LSRSSKLSEVGFTAFALVAPWDLDLISHNTGMQGEMHPPAQTELRIFAIRGGSRHGLFIPCQGAVHDLQVLVSISSTFGAHDEWSGIALVRRGKPIRSDFNGVYSADDWVYRHEAVLLGKCPLALIA
jgi:hypothetical protein